MALKSFDVSGWGFFRFIGPDARKFLQGLVTADVARLSAGVMLPACVLTPKGLLVADCELYEEAPDAVLAVTRPAAAAGFQKAFEKKIMLSQSRFERRTTGRACLVIGPEFSGGLAWTRFGITARLLLDVPPPVEAAALSLSEFEALRVAAGFPWYGLDMDETALPLESRQEDSISLTKGCYMGQETVSRIVHLGRVNRLLAALRFDGAAPAPGTALTRDGARAGAITSASGDRALAMVRRDDSSVGTRLDAGPLRGEVVVVPSWPASLSRA